MFCPNVTDNPPHSGASSHGLQVVNHVPRCSVGLYVLWWTLEPVLLDHQYEPPSVCWYYIILDPTRSPVGTILTGIQDMVFVLMGQYARLSPYRIVFMF